METQRALAAEIRAEMASRHPRITAAEMQQRTGIKHASWRNYFVTVTRAVPYPEVVKVCKALGVKPSEMMRRAELRVAEDSLAEHIANQLRPETQERVRQLREEMAERTRAKESNG